MHGIMTRYYSNLKSGYNVFIKDRSLKSQFVLARYILRKSLMLNVPMVAEIAVTSRCQLKCRHCSQGDFRKEENLDEFSTEKIKNLIDQLLKLGCFRVGFFGGEPLLRKDLFKLIKYATDKGMATRVTTNGLLLSEKNVLKLKKAGLSMLNVSIDSPDPERHDTFRGLKGCYEKAVAGMQRAVKAGLTVQIETYISRELLNNNGIQDMKNLAKSLNVFGVYALFSMMTGKWEDNWDELLTLEEREKARQYHNTEHPPYFRLEFPTEETICYVGKKKQIYISPFGNVSPCSCLHSWYGNIHDKPLKEIWQEMSQSIHVTNSGQCPSNDPVFRNKYLKTAAL